MAEAKKKEKRIRVNPSQVEMLEDGSIKISSSELSRLLETENLEEAGMSAQSAHFIIIAVGAEA